jgi:hypothetical protein
MDLVTVTLTKEQHNLMVELFEQRKRQDLRIADWLGWTEEEIEARFQIPHDTILEDMAEWNAAQRMGLSFS